MSRITGLVPNNPYQLLLGPTLPGLNSEMERLVSKLREDLKEQESSSQEAVAKLMAELKV